MTPATLVLQNARDGLTHSAAAVTAMLVAGLVFAAVIAVQTRLLTGRQNRRDDA